VSLDLRQIELGPMKNFVYLVGDTDTKKCWVVDPAWDIEVVLQEARQAGYALAGALVTHSHFDHCNALDRLLRANDVPIYVHKREIDTNPTALETGIFCALPMENVRPVSSGDVLTLGSVRLTVLHTPGHTPGSQCLLVDGNLISGDTLFLGGCGRCDLPGGDPRELYESLQKTIARLPDDTQVLPGHNYSEAGRSNALGAEKAANRFLQARSLPDFLSLVGM
jgi:hydroxyacylglutathione hydrolase